MPISENWNGYVAFKEQSALGSQASGAGATILWTSGGAGGLLSKAAVESRIIRHDAQQFRGRHGSRRTAGNYNSELSIGRCDPILEAIMRNSFAAQLSVNQADAGLTSITTGTNTIVASAGSWITAGLRVGDVVRMSGHATVANNSRNLRITGLTASTITVPETLTADAVADTAFTITRQGRTLTNGVAGAIERPYFTLEEHEYDLDASEVFTDVRFSRMMLRMQADGLLDMELGWTGTGKSEVKSGASAPHFTSPADPVALSLNAAECIVRLGSTDVAELTQFDFTIDLQPSAPAVINSTGLAPDVFLGTFRPSMNLTVMRKDLLALADFDAETQLSLHLLATEQEAEPKDFFSLVVPNFTLGGVAKSELSKAGGPRTVRLSIPQELIGKDTRGGAFNATTVQMQISNSS